MVLGWNVRDRIGFFSWMVFVGVIMSRWVLCNCTYGCEVFMYPSSGFFNLAIFSMSFKVHSGLGVSVNYKFQGMLQLMQIDDSWGRMVITLFHVYVYGWK